MGLMFAGSNPAAVDWVGAHLLGYEPAKISLAREAFGHFRWPLVSSSRADVRVIGDCGEGVADEVLTARMAASPVIYPAGWGDAARDQNLGGERPAEAPSNRATESLY